VLIEVKKARIQSDLLSNNVSRAIALQIIENRFRAASLQLSLSRFGKFSI